MLQFLLIVFLSFQTVYAQNSRVDSLQQILNTTQADTARVRLLNEMSALLWYSDTDRSLSLARQALSLAKKTGYMAGIKTAYNNIGVINDTQGNYPEALQCFLKTLEISEQTQDEKTTASVLNNVGVLYEYLGEYKQALHYYERSLLIKEKQQDEYGIALAYNNLGVVYAAMGNTEQALNFHLKALDIRERLEYHRGIANTLNNVGRIYLAQGRLQEAQACFQRALALNKELDDKSGYAYSLQNLAAVCYEKQQYQQVLSYAHTSYQLANILNAKLHIQESCRLLFHTYKALHDYQNAFKYQSVYISYHDSLTSEENKKKIEKLQSSYEIQSRDAEIALLNKDKRLHEAETHRLKAEAGRKNLFLFASTSFLVLLLLLAVILIRYNQQQKKTNQLLQKKNEEIRRTNFHLNLKNQEIELRNEEIVEQKKTLEDLNGIKDRLFSIIAHDFRSPLNSLQGTLSLLQLEAISYEEIKKVLPGIISKVDHTVSLLDNLLNWARAQMSGMKTRPLTFDLQAVTEETVHLLKSQAHEKGILLHNLIPATIPVYADPDMVKLVIRNLISNAIKFTNAGDVISVKIKVADEYCQVAIADTGCGIDKGKLKYLFMPGSNSTLGTSNEKGTGLGLWICRDFVEKNGGIIWAESEEGKGSVFYFTLPCSMESVEKKLMAEV